MSSCKVTALTGRYSQHSEYRVSYIKPHRTDTIQWQSSRPFNWRRTNALSGCRCSWMCTVILHLFYLLSDKPETLSLATDCRIAQWPPLSPDLWLHSPLDMKGLSRSCACDSVITAQLILQQNKCYSGLQGQAESTLALWSNSGETIRSMSCSLLAASGEC